MPVKYLDSVYYAAIKVKAANVYVSDTFVPVCISEANVAAAATGAYRADGADVVVTTEAGVLVPREIASFNRAGGTFQIWYRDPAQDSATGGTQLYLQWGGASVNVANAATVWSGNYGGSINHALVLHGEESGANLIDSSGNYTATDTDITYNQTGKIKKAPELNGSTSSSNFGAVQDISNKTKLTVMNWLNIQTIDANSNIFGRTKNADNNVIWRTTTAGNGVLAFFLETAGTGVGYYEPVAMGYTLNTWEMFTAVFDGTLSGDANRCKIYQGKTQQSLTFAGSMPSVTTTFTTENAFLGNDGINVSFDGLVDEFRIIIGALSLNQIKGQYDNQSGFATNATITIGAVTIFSSLVTQQSHIAIYNGIGIM